MKRNLTIKMIRAGTKVEIRIATIIEEEVEAEGSMNRGKTIQEMITITRKAEVEEVTTKRITPINRKMTMSMRINVSYLLPHFIINSNIESENTGYHSHKYEGTESQQK